MVTENKLEGFEKIDNVGYVASREACGYEDPTIDYGAIDYKSYYGDWYDVVYDSEGTPTGGYFCLKIVGHDAQRRVLIDQTDTVYAIECWFQRGRMNKVDWITTNPYEIADMSSFHAMMKQQGVVPHVGVKIVSDRKGFVVRTWERLKAFFVR